MVTRAGGGDGGLLAGLVPAGVVARELVADLRVQGDDSGLSPEEAAVVAAAVPRRRRQFAAGRRLAREALVEGKRHLFEAEMKEDRRTQGKRAHEPHPETGE